MKIYGRHPCFTTGALHSLECYHGVYNIPLLQAPAACSTTIGEWGLQRWYRIVLSAAPQRRWYQYYRWYRRICDVTLIRAIPLASTRRAPRGANWAAEVKGLSCLPQTSDGVNSEKKFSFGGNLRFWCSQIQRGQHDGNFCYVEERFIDLKNVM